jgi:peptidoglycan/LPS O-acetylase OafA/YrhL
MEAKSFPMDSNKIERFLEFLLIGVVFGTVEDLIAVKLATGETISLEMIGIVVAVAIPFAAFSELYIDHPEVRPLRNHAEKMEAYLKNKL